MTNPKDPLHGDFPFYSVYKTKDNKFLSVGVVEVNSSAVTINISSDPQQATLSEGETKKFDVTEDDYYDIQITLNDISGSKANLTVKSIYEEIPANLLTNCTTDWQCTNWSDCKDGEQTRVCTDASSCETSADKPSEAQACGGDGGGKGNIRYLVWIVIGIVALIVFLLVAEKLYSQHRKKRYYQKGH